MAQAFLDYDGQVDKLINKKELIVDDREYVIGMLTQISYFSLIGGYKNMFINPTMNKYKRGVRFVDIVSLYRFDEELRSLLMKYILKFERKLHSVISYHFTETYGEKQSFYLDVNSYDCIPTKIRGINSLVSRLNKLATQRSDYEYINYHRNKYSNIPLWVLINALTLGTISKFYQFSKPSLQTKICKDFENLNEKQLEQILSVMTKFRNVCAHGERLFSYHTKDCIGNLVIHKKLGISMHKKQYIYGKNDLFAVIISLRYVLSKDDFLKLKNELSKLIDKLLKDTSCLSENEILKAMGFPINWKKISSIRKIS